MARVPLEILFAGIPCEKTFHDPSVFMITTSQNAYESSHLVKNVTLSWTNFEGDGVKFCGAPAVINK